MPAPVSCWRSVKVSSVRSVPIAAAVGAVSAAAICAASAPRATFITTSVVVVALSLAAYFWGRTAPAIGHAQGDDR